MRLKSRIDVVNKVIGEKRAGEAAEVLRQQCANLSPEEARRMYNELMLTPTALPPKPSNRTLEQAAEDYRRLCG